MTETRGKSVTLYLDSTKQGFQNWLTVHGRRHGLDLGIHNVQAHRLALVLKSAVDGLEPDKGGRIPHLLSGTEKLSLPAEFPLLVFDVVPVSQDRLEVRADNHRAADDAELCRLFDCLLAEIGEAWPSDQAENQATTHKETRALGMRGDTFSRVREAYQLMRWEGLRKTEACRRASTDTRTYDKWIDEVAPLEVLDEE